MNDVENYKLGSCVPFDFTWLYSILSQFGWHGLDQFWR